jgi:hypothetical protein
VKNVQTCLLALLVLVHSMISTGGAAFADPLEPDAKFGSILSDLGSVWTTIGFSSDGTLYAYGKRPNDAICEILIHDVETGREIAVGSFDRFCPENGHWAADSNVLAYAACRQLITKLISMLGMHLPVKRACSRPMSMSNGKISLTIRTSQQMENS